MSDFEIYFQTRLPPDPRRRVLWKTLWDCHFRPLIHENDSVLDFGAGYCDFINHVCASKRFAVDIWPDFVKHAAPGVNAYVSDLTDLSWLADGSVDFIFCSNVFEHIEKADLSRILTQFRAKLSERGRLCLIQPNYRYCSKQYFDDYTHITVFSHVSLQDFLQAHGFKILDCRPRFLPLTVKSRLPVHPLLIRAYLALPFKPQAKQMLVLAEPIRSRRGDEDWSGMNSEANSRPNPSFSSRPAQSHGARARFALVGSMLLLLGLAMYLSAIFLSLLRLAFFPTSGAVQLVARILWYSGLPTSFGIILILLDFFVLLPQKRLHDRRIENRPSSPKKVTVALTSYNDEASIGTTVRDFVSHPMVTKVIVVDNNSKDRSAAVAAEAGARVVIEMRPGYGSCAHRCLRELHEQSDTEYVILCEGDMTFRAHDIEKLASYAPHADIVNGTRIVEQLRAYKTQLSTFMYYGNFFVGKLLEIKHFGKGTFTDVGTTYKLLRREILPTLVRELNPSINLEFNAYFMDRVLSMGYLLLECPITFHQRVGLSKGGNTNNLRALKVGARMILGLLTDWQWGGGSRERRIGQQNYAMIGRPPGRGSGET